MLNNRDLHLYRDLCENPLDCSHKVPLGFMITLCSIFGGTASWEKQRKRRCLNMISSRQEEGVDSSFYMQMAWPETCSQVACKPV